MPDIKPGDALTVVQYWRAHAPAIIAARAVLVGVPPDGTVLVEDLRGERHYVSETGIVSVNGVETRAAT